MVARPRTADGHGAVVAFLENRGGDAGATLAGPETLTSRAQVFDGEAKPDHSNGHAALTQRHGPPEPTTPYAFAEIAFTPSVKAAQQRDGSRAGYARNFERDAEVSNDRLGHDVVAD